MITVDGERVVVGGAGRSVGSEFTISVELISPLGVERFENTQITGNLSVMDLVSQEVTP